MHHTGSILVQYWFILVQYWFILVQYWFILHHTGSISGFNITSGLRSSDKSIHSASQAINRTSLVDRRREIRGEIRRWQGLVSALYRVVSLDKKHCSTLSLSTQVYKWLPANCWGILTEKLNATLRWNNVTNMNSVLFSFATPIWSIFSRNPLRVTDTGCTGKNTRVFRSCLRGQTVFSYLSLTFNEIYLRK